MMKRLFVLLLGCLSLLSCEKGNGALFRTTVMGTVDLATGAFRDDNGWSYIFLDEAPDFVQEREVVCCDVIRIDEADRRYQAVLQSLTHPLYQSPLLRSQVPGWAAFGPDPIRLTGLWYSGNHLNMTFQVSHSGSQELAHQIRLVYDDIDSTPERFRFYLKHDAAGDTDERTASLDASFPVADILAAAAEKGTVQLEVIWFWGGLSRTSRLVLAAS